VTIEEPSPRAVYLAESLKGSCVRRAAVQGGGNKQGQAEHKELRQGKKKLSQARTAKLFRLQDWMGTGPSTTVPGRSGYDSILSTRG